MEEVKKQGMESLFCPYEPALRLKALGFNEPCFGYYNKCVLSIEIIKSGKIFTNEDSIYFDKDSSCLASTFSQAFRWFRAKYSICVEIHETTDWEEDNESWSFVIFKYRLGDNDGMISSTVDYDTYEEAELACLEKLIEIVESKQK